MLQINSVLTVSRVILIKQILKSKPCIHIQINRDKPSEINHSRFQKMASTFYATSTPVSRRRTDWTSSNKAVEERPTMCVTVDTSYSEVVVRPTLQSVWSAVNSEATVTAAWRGLLHSYTTHYRVGGIHTNWCTFLCRRCGWVHVVRGWGSEICKFEFRLSQRTVRTYHGDWRVDYL